MKKQEKIVKYSYLILQQSIKGQRNKQNKNNKKKARDMNRVHRITSMDVFGWLFVKF